MSIPNPDRSRLGVLEPKIAVHQPSALIWRLYRSDGQHSVSWNELCHFGPVASRFDHHLEDGSGWPYAQERGVLYGAPDLITCIAEFFQAGRHIDRTGKGPRVAAFHLLEPIELLDLGGRFITLAGCHQGIHSSPLRRRTRAWARAFYDAYPGIHGLLYRSKMAVDLPACALFERAANAFPANPLCDLSLDDERLDAPLAAAAKELGYSLG